MTTDAHVIDATLAPMADVVAALRGALVDGAAVVELRVVEPALAVGSYPGELVERDGTRWRHQPWRAWVELAERLDLRVAIIADGAAWRLRLTRLADHTALPAPGADAPHERYGVGSSFDRIATLDDPTLLVDLDDALARLVLPPGARVLELGCGRGAFAAWLRHRRPDVVFVGVDHSASALAAARAVDPAGTFVERDLASLADLGRFDLIVAIGVLQSRDLDDRELVQRVVTTHLTPDGGVLLGIPNCRYRDGELRPGARQKNYAQPELGLVVRDLAYYRRYLQQKRRRVFITGRHTLLVTAVVDGAGATS